MKEASIRVWVIEIDDSKVEYIATKDVTPLDVYEVHGLAPRYFLRNEAWSLYNMIGPSQRGRFLVVGLQLVIDQRYRLVTAYWNDDGRAQRIYEGAR